METNKIAEGNDSVDANHHAGFVALIGLPNAGKSTLLNKALQQKISIISSKPQTTRNRILGIVNADNLQVALMDTPGIHRPKQRLHRVMVRAAEQIIPDMDAVVWVLDVIPMLDRLRKGKEVFWGGSLHIAKLLQNVEHLTITLNKIDKIAKPELLPLLHIVGQRFPEAEIIPISALKTNNIDALLKIWSKQLPPNPPLFPKDQITDVSERFLVSELIREKVFHLTNQEVPYSVAVEVEKFIESKKLIKVYAKIWVERSSHKGIIIGKGGALLKKIGSRARQEMELLLGNKVWLDIHVSIKEKWTENPRNLRELGYE